MKKSILLSFACYILFSTTALSQHENKKWYFGNWCGLDFMTSPPTVLNTYSITIPAGCGTASDPAGNLLFFTDGQSVWDRSFSIMANGSGLAGGFFSSQSGLIVKQPGNANIYFIFSSATNAGAAGINYSVVDMSLAAGMGSVTAKNVQLYTPACEKLTPVRHCNGIDVWVLTHEWNTNKFKAYLITAAGVNTAAVVSAAGPTPVVNSYNQNSQASGDMKASPNGLKIGLATYNNSVPTTGRFELYDFNPSTGAVSNPLILANIMFPYGCEFSPDGSKFYGARYNNDDDPSKIIQWDVCAGSNADIAASQYAIVPPVNMLLGSMQRGPDGKIYIATCGAQYLAVIDRPNAPGAACSFSYNGLSLSPQSSAFGLPSFMFVPEPMPVSHTVNCQVVSYTGPATGNNLSVNCSPGGYAASSLSWNFGDPASGTANQSTVSAPSHLYSGTGSYITTLIITRPCSVETVTIPVAISALSPTITVSGTFSMCAGQTLTLGAAGAASYNWVPGGSVSASITVSPAATTVYTLTGSSGACSVSRPVTITVSECTGLKVSEAGRRFNLYPNPTRQMLDIEASTPLNVSIYNQLGVKLLDTDINAGKNILNLETLPNGIYLIKAQAADGLPAGISRLVKSE